MRACQAEYQLKHIKANAISRSFFGGFLVFLSLLVSGCASANSQVNSQQSQPASTFTPSLRASPGPTQPTASLSARELQNAQYELPELGRLQLRDGKYENRYGSGATQVNRVTFQTYALGDLNSDGVPDAAVVLAWDSGGSGTFVFLAAVVNEGGTPKQAAVEPLGDRVTVRGLSIDNKAIVLQEKGFSPGDPQCCPSQEIARTYKLDGGKLTAESQVTQTPPLSPIASAEALIQFRFDTQKHQCSNTPAPVLGDRAWQDYAAPINGKGGDPIKAGQVITLNLRDKLGPATDRFDLTVMIIAPDGSRTSASLTLNGNDWATVAYPLDFTGARPTAAGVYTVLWEIPAGVVACDGFEVKGG